MTELSVQCSSCQEESPLQTSFITERGICGYQPACTVVYHSIATGGGYEGLTSFCSIMNMPCLSKPGYYQHVETILDALELDTQEGMEAAGQKSDLQASRKEKKRRQAEQLRQTQRARHSQSIS